MSHFKHCQWLKNAGMGGFCLFLPISIAFAQMFLGIFALAFITETWLLRRVGWPFTPINRPLLGYIFLTFITTGFALNLKTSVRGLKGLLIISVFYLFYFSISELRTLKKCLFLILFGMTFAACYGILQHSWGTDPFRLTRPLSLLKHVNNDLAAPVRIAGFSSYMTFAGQLSMAIPLLCAYGYATASKKAKGLALTAMMLAGLALLWTYTRSAWLGAACGLMPFGLLKGKKFSLRILLILVLVVVTLCAIQPDIFERFQSIFRTKENLERLYTWESSVQIIRDHVLVGIGKGNFPKIADSYRTIYGDFEFTSHAHAHNNILQIAVEGGILTLLCFLWLWTVMFQTVYQTVRNVPFENVERKYLALGCLGGLIAFFVQGMFEFNFGDSESVMLMWTIMAFGAKLYDLTFPEFHNTH